MSEAAFASPAVRVLLDAPAPLSKPRGGWTFRQRVCMPNKDRLLVECHALKGSVRPGGEGQQASATRATMTTVAVMGSMVFCCL
ncbi:hypothetical protein [Synechococcus sp. UW179A]|uniref:hypothetical protein n=1 Tax=Synechococcus sp. UW179A TaxID=2575510 RepID=UPI001A7E0C50|nr:hypothetical protein [Synechococcus sp. UW179A]